MPRTMITRAAWWRYGKSSGNDCMRWRERIAGQIYWTADTKWVCLILVACRVIWKLAKAISWSWSRQLAFWRDDQTSSFRCSPVDSLNNVDHLCVSSLYLNPYLQSLPPAYLPLPNYCSSATSSHEMGRTFCCYYQFLNLSWYVCYWYQLLSWERKGKLTGKRTWGYRDHIIRTSTSQQNSSHAHLRKYPRLTYLIEIWHFRDIHCSISSKSTTYKTRDLPR